MGRTYYGQQTCDVCGRVRTAVSQTEDHKVCAEKVRGDKVYYVHSYYGCDTGCCGHTIYIENARGDTVSSEFYFEHDKEDLDERVREMAYFLRIEVGECEHIDSC